MRPLIDKLRQERTLPLHELRALLRGIRDDDTLDYLTRQARQVATTRFGNAIYIRGLIEVSSYCHNNCLYCGIRKDNMRAERYRLSKEQILACCREGHTLGFRTFVLQGGEDPAQTDSWVEDTVRAIREEFPENAITLSLGEKSRESYQRFFQAGANRYLLRHETRDPDHYASLHPQEMSLKRRLRCLDDLKAIGYQTGTGFMVGSRGQTIAHLVQDILYIKELRPEMIGIGPFLPHRDTPLALCPAGTIEQTLALIAIFRLMRPDALIPSTTALATLDPDGRERGILAGANVVMPNLSPADDRRKYELYDRKAALGAESAEGLDTLRTRLRAIGYDISFEKGDYNELPT
ncbi:MAG: [FeFe] hydrogenase H-cluster radical SAM maturase HydE [Mediterranea sp.]|jgi:biotin synthase|nr:[FeFe] hydrogenase H-cluster radical SAM maturase HydE [Mediterranea sp.]